MGSGLVPFLLVAPCAAGGIHLVQVQARALPPRSTELLRTAEGAWAQAEASEAQLADLEEDARLGTEHAELIQERAQLELEEVQLRAEQQRLRTENARLRAQDQRLRAEDADVRAALAWARRNETYALQPAQPPFQAREKIKFPVLVGAGLAVLGFITYVSSTCLGAEVEEITDARSNARKQEQRLRDMVRRRRSWDCCCCSRSLCYFFVGTVVVSISAGCVLWELGILQQVAADFFMYFYVVFLLAAFISLLLFEVWRVVRRLVQLMLDRLQDVTGPFRGMGFKGKSCGSNLLDDGALNSTLVEPDLPRPGRARTEAPAPRTKGLRRFST